MNRIAVYDNEMGLPIVAPERTFTRARRCANCTAFETGAMSHQQWNTHRKARQDDYLKTMPISRLADMEKPDWSPSEKNDARLQQLMQMDHMIANSMAGLCMKGARSAKDGGPEGDFVHAEFLCDRWTGIEGVGEMTRGHEDKLGGELHEIADDRAEKA
ncbi:MAG: hypothetical protein JWO36_3419 [Myxococcales bacterium]|nr:hypothetical protein [Myxococcales bacterium]